MAGGTRARCPAAVGMSDAASASARTGAGPGAACFGTAAAARSLTWGGATGGCSSPLEGHRRRPGGAGDTGLGPGLAHAGRIWVVALGCPVLAVAGPQTEAAFQARDFGLERVAGTGVSAAGPERSSAVSQGVAPSSRNLAEAGPRTGRADPVKDLHRAGVRLCSNVVSPGIGWTVSRSAPAEDRSYPVGAGPRAVEADRPV
jgi:hypothetical protein